jgi:hypothetical protein
VPQTGGISKIIGAGITKISWRSLVLVKPSKAKSS